MPKTCFVNVLLKLILSPVSNEGSEPQRWTKAFVPRRSAVSEQGYLALWWIQRKDARSKMTRWLKLLGVFFFLKQTFFGLDILSEFRCHFGGLLVGSSTMFNIHSRLRKHSFRACVLWQVGFNKAWEMSVFWGLARNTRASRNISRSRQMAWPRTSSALLAMLVEDSHYLTANTFVLDVQISRDGELFYWCSIDASGMFNCLAGEKCQPIYPRGSWIHMHYPTLSLSCTMSQT